MISDGLDGASFLPHPYREIDNKKNINKSIILVFILSYPFKNLFLALLIAFNTFFGAVPP